MFLDKTDIYIKAGDGGNGVVSFHTEKFVPNGGPDGGNGGMGGDIIFVASNSESTLNEFHYQKHFVAKNGENGAGKKCNGRAGASTVIPVPCGTIIRDYETGRVIADMFFDGERTVVYKGGKGGRGNACFANARRQAPHFAQDGEKRPVRRVTLELKTIADVGLIGFPNVGKSTLLSVLTKANPKIAAYPFTTLTPNLGVCSHKDRTFVIADIPGLIEGAHSGAGLGHEFLRHIERTRLLVHVVDISQEERESAAEDFKTINAELSAYSKTLAALSQIVVANKTDMPQAEQNLKDFSKAIGKKHKIIPISAVRHEGLTALLDEIIMRLAALPPTEKTEYEPFEFAPPDATQFDIKQLAVGVFEVVGGLRDDLERKIYFDDTDSFRYFQRSLEKYGVIDALKQRGIKEGDTVIFGDIRFDFME